MSDAELALRRALRAEAMDLVPARYLDEVVDLAIHAANKAFEATSAVVSRASIAPIAICATSMALSIIAAEAKVKLEQFAKDAADLGATVTYRTVRT